MSELPVESKLLPAPEGRRRPDLTPVSHRSSAWQILLRKPVSIAGAFVVLMWTLLALLAPLIAPYDPVLPNSALKLAAPSAVHWFGTDAVGRDILSRVLFGGRLTMWMGLLAVAISFVIGVPLGAVAGYTHRRISGVIMRLMDIFLAFPSLILAMAIAAALGPGIFSAMIAVGIVGIPEFARIMYGLTRSLHEREFVEAAYAVGLNPSQILLRHVFPNALGPLLVRASLGMGFAILTAASLSFIGLGTQPPTAEWGIMISDARGYIITGQWWMTTFPGLAIATSILGFNLFGDALRDVLDPRLRTSS